MLNLKLTRNSDGHITNCLFKKQTFTLRQSFTNQSCIRNIIKMADKAKDETNKAKDEADKAEDEAVKAKDEADRQRIFKSFDSNGDGQISASELELQLKKLGKVSQDDFKNMMKEIDTDGDGFISFQEFTDFATANKGLIRDVAKLFY